MALTDLLTSSAHEIPLGGLFAMKGSYHQPAAMTDNLTFDNQYPLWVGLDPNNGGGRVITLDGIATAAGSPEHDGLWRIITNRADAAEDLTVNDAQTAPATIGTVSQNETGVFFHDGDSGWTLVFLITGALA